MKKGDDRDRSKAKIDGNGKKRHSINWDNYIMRKFGQSTRKNILEVHVPFLQIMMAQKIQHALKEQELLATTKSTAVH